MLLSVSLWVADCWRDRQSVYQGTQFLYAKKGRPSYGASTSIWFCDFWYDCNHRIFNGLWKTWKRIGKPFINEVVNKNPTSSVQKRIFCWCIRSRWKLDPSYKCICLQVASDIVLFDRVLIKDIALEQFVFCHLPLLDMGLNVWNSKIKQ